VHQSRAAVFAAIGDHARSIEDYSAAIRFDVQYALAYQGRGDAYARTGQPERALQDYTESIRLNPKNAYAYYSRALVYAGKNEYQRSIEELNEAIQRRPDFTLALRQRGINYQKLDQYERAVADFDAVIRLDARDTVALNELAWLLATSKQAQWRDGNRAVELARSACNTTGWKIPDLFDTYAAALAEAGKFDDAVKWQEAALESAEFARAHGEGARARLQLYREGKPYHTP
jgi:tetratricopeptide (TPR) repeat protein